MNSIALNDECWKILANTALKTTWDQEERALSCPGFNNCTTQSVNAHLYYKYIQSGIGIHETVARFNYTKSWFLFNHRLLSNLAVKMLLC